MPFIYQKKLNPLEQSGCKGQPCHPSGQRWHPVTCHILEDCTGCKPWHCFPFELRSTQSPQASLVKGRVKNCWVPWNFSRTEGISSMDLQSPGETPLCSPAALLLVVCSGNSALPSAHHTDLLWQTALHQDSPPWSSQLFRLKVKIPSTVNYGRFQCLHLRRMKAWFNF